MVRLADTAVDGNGSPQNHSREQTLLQQFRSERNLTVGVSDLRVTRDANTVIVTHSLGSCIAVTAVDLQARVGGLLHFQLPDSTADATRTIDQPFMYADTGLAALLEQIQQHGGARGRLRICIAGGASMLGASNNFDIGRRNHAAIRKALWKQGLFVDAEDCGGHNPRTLSFRVRDGAILIRYGSDIRGLGNATARALDSIASDAPTPNPTLPDGTTRTPRRPIQEGAS